MTSIQSEEAGSADDALLKLPGDYNLLISDIRLKKMDGIGQLETALRMQPGIPVIMIAGFGGVEIKEESKAKGEWDSSINHSACWINLSVLFKR